MLEWEKKERRKNGGKRMKEWKKALIKERKCEWKRNK